MEDVDIVVQQKCDHDLLVVLRKCDIAEELVPRFLEESGLASVAALGAAESADIKELLMVLGQKKVQAGSTATRLLRAAASEWEASTAKTRRTSLVAIVGTKEWAAANNGRRLPPQLHSGTWVSARCARSQHFAVPAPGTDLSGVRTVCDAANALCSPLAPRRAPSPAALCALTANTANRTTPGAVKFIAGSVASMGTRTRHTAARPTVQRTSASNTAACGMVSGCRPTASRTQTRRASS